MFATHPVSGQQVRIIQTDASTWKERKTLAFSGERGVYDTVCDKGSPDFYILMDSGSAAAAAAAGTKLILVPKARAGFPAQNVLVLEEVHLMYPHVGDPWDGTAEDAAVILAVLLRYRYVVGVWNARAASHGLQVGSAPFRLWWITQYYKSSSGGSSGSRRRKEIDTCLERNAASGLIDRIILLNEKAETLPAKGRVPIEERVIGRRLSYADVIRAAEEFPDDVVVAFANADICIDDSSWRQLWQVNLEGKFLALLRYDVPASGRVEDATIFGPRADSQDTWVVRAADLKGRNAADALDFNFGRMGCDNAIAIEMLRKKFVVMNPCLSLKTWHFHASEVRNYVKTDIIERTVFHYVGPSGFHDLNPVLTFSGAEVVDKFTPAPLTRIVRGSAAARWLMAANKKLDPQDTALKLVNENTVVPVSQTVLHLKNCFQTSGGLVFDANRLMIGPSVRSQKIWNTAEVSAMTPSLECKRGLVSAWHGESREDYILHYMSKILGLRDASAAAGQGWEFFCSDQKDFVEALEAFTWNADRLPVIKHEKDVVVWCSEAFVRVVSDTACVLKEDVDALRVSLRGFTMEFDGRRRVVVVQDGRVLTEEAVRSIETVLEGAGYTVGVVYAGRTSAYRMATVMRGAMGVICGGGLIACGWNWMLPVGAFVFEVVGSNKPPPTSGEVVGSNKPPPTSGEVVGSNKPPPTSGEVVSAEAAAAAAGDLKGLEISAAADLEHRFSSVEKVAEEVVALGAKAAAAATADAGAADLPVVWLPRADLEGYFAHPGDSFREMVRLWGAAGLCRVREHPTATMVWWGDVGEVLLYDRPNHDWRLAAPAVERAWKKALFGNPRPAAGGIPWFFWPRRPELVEELAAAAATPFEARRPGLVFYGKTENKLQEKRRAGAWESVCSEWKMSRGATDPYALTQREYLEALSQARFGLCLAGYGLKCHREVECMAMGCVPVVAPEVDMESYAVPPQAGVHYIRAATPEEAGLVVESMSSEVWALMSEAGRAWWRANASCAGSFSLTKRLVEGFSAAESS